MWIVVPFSVMGESGRSLCVFGHVEEESFFLGILTVRYLLQIHLMTLLTASLALNPVVHPTTWQFTVLLW